MNKDEAVKLLNDNGYQAKRKDGIVIVESDNQNDFKKIGRILKKAGYKESYGWRKVNGEKQEAEAE